MGHIVDPAVLDGGPRAGAIAPSDPSAPHGVPQLVALLLRLLELGAQGFDAIRQLFGGGIEQPRSVGQEVAISPHQLVRGLSHDHVDAP